MQKIYMCRYSSENNMKMDLTETEINFPPFTVYFHFSHGMPDPCTTIAILQQNTL